MFETACGLRDRGHDVLLFCQRGSPLAVKAEQASLAVNAQFNLNRGWPSDVAGGLRALRQALREFRPDILNPHCPPGHSYLALARWREGAKTPMIRTIADPRPPKRNLVNRVLHTRHTQGLIFTTQASRGRYESALDLSRLRTRVIHPGFRADEFVAGVASEGLRARLGVAPHQLLAGVVARMSPEKGQEVLIEALALLPTDVRSSLVCVLAGEDSRERGRPELQRLAERLGVQQQTVWLARLEDVRPLLSELDLGIISSTSSEAICRVALEYMSFGVPVIASNVNVLPEVIRDGENGWVFPNRNARRLAECLQEAVANPALLEQRGNRGAELVRSTFSLTQEIDETVAFFHEILSATQGDGR